MCPDAHRELARAFVRQTLGPPTPMLIDKMDGDWIFRTMRAENRAKVEAYYREKVAAKAKARAKVKR